ncbi:MAG: hypothetical protein KDM63_22530, partial [Verrucomicrobiae bacterium]|nr:hypothetical protein [Verrucomicrobiae bacterium]
TFTITVYAYNSLGRSLALQFDLVIEAIDEDETGRFSGLVEADPVLSQELGGKIDLTVTKTGYYTATLRLGRELYRLKGRALSEIGGSLTIERQIARRGRAPLAIDIQVHTDGTFSGALDDTEGVGDHAAFEGLKSPWNKVTNPVVDHLGAFNLAMDPPVEEEGNAAVPQGAGFMRCLVDSSGLVRWSGRSGDGLA